MKKPVVSEKLRLRGEYVIKVHDGRSGALKRVLGPFRNLVMKGTGTGYDLVTRALGGDVTYQLAIDEAQIGTGSTAPAASDTALQTPVLTGIDLALSEYPVAGQVTLSFFATDGALANGTYNEVGLFANGQLFARSIISPAYTKGSSENTTIEYTITA